MKTYVIKDLTTSRRFAKSFSKGLERPLQKTSTFFKALGTLIDTDVQNQFRSEGKAGGYREIPFSKQWSPLRSRIGSPRPGTDGSRSRVFTANSKPLQASGLFRKSFNIQSVTDNGLVYGTNHRLRNEIGKAPYRPVLFVTEKDQERYNKKFSTFIRQGIKFE